MGLPLFECAEMTSFVQWMLLKDDGLAAPGHHVRNIGAYSKYDDALPN